MSLLTILLVLCVAGVLLWLINEHLPMDAKVKMILNVVAIIILVVWLLKVFGVWHQLGHVHI